MQKKDPSCFWGFPKAAVHDLGQRLQGFWEKFRGGFKTKIRDGSAYARHDLSGVLRMRGERHFTGIGREAGVDGQNIQHFMSESPWSGEAVCGQMQDDLLNRTRSRVAPHLTVVTLPLPLSVVVCAWVDVLGAWVRPKGTEGP